MQMNHTDMMDEWRRRVYERALGAVAAMQSTVVAEGVAWYRNCVRGINLRTQTALGTGSARGVVDMRKVPWVFDVRRVLWGV